MATRLTFGTAGIRAKLGDGDDALNDRTVTSIIAGVCRHLHASRADAAEAGVCIGFDGRRCSDTFAALAVQTVRAHGIKVLRFETPVPTPLLAFATRLHQAAAGIMITASHNPPDDNGIKVYLAGGAQLGAPDDAQILQQIAAYDAQPAHEPAGSAPLVTLGEHALEQYLRAVLALVPFAPEPLPRFAYSALAGVGGAVTRALFARLGLRDVLEVTEEAEPRSDFAGIREPNPEHPAALARLRSLSEHAQVGLAFAHDPDADRLAVLVRETGGGLRILSGDELGALLGAFLLQSCGDPSQVLLVSTLVSGGLLEQIARAQRAHYVRTPTGFKHIAARARAIARRDGLRFLFGYEEAIGYAFGDMADDKDGIAALYVTLALVQQLAREGRTLSDALDALFVAHGVFATRQLTVARDAAAPDPMVALRALTAETLLGPGAQRIDYASEPERLALLVFRGVDGSKLCARPSGTEPKLKLYLEVRAEVSAHASLQAAKVAAERALDALAARVRAIVTP